MLNLLFIIADSLKNELIWHEICRISNSFALDFGRGNYLLKNNSIDFNDEEARIALYAWEWILGGTHQLRIAGESLILNQNTQNFSVSCRLIKTAELHR
jgi:hypothetical protein